MDSIGEKDCNSKELARLLVGSIQRLLNLNQWNDFIKLQAIDDPFKFVEEVAKHSETLEKEDESKGNFHLRITGISPEGRNNKIGCIKILRSVMGWGLADSKVSYEALPGSGAGIEKSNFTIITRAFVSQESLMDSHEWKEFNTGKNLFFFEVIRLPNTDASKPFVSNGY